MAVTTLFAAHCAADPIDNIKPTLALAKNLGAHLNLVTYGVMETIPPAAYGGLPASYLSDAHGRVVEDTNHRMALIEEHIQEAYLSASLLAEYINRGMVSRTMSRYALYADITVFAHQSLLRHEPVTDAFNGILLETGRPVLILGKGDDPTLSAKRVMMAWNAEPEAARAIHQSLPLLANGADVHLVLVDPQPDQSDSNPGDDMAALLTRHNLKVTVDQIPSAGKDVSDVLLQHAVDKDADLIVMGGYGHSRLREWLLGGTTRDLIKKAEIPILMAH